MIETSDIPDESLHADIKKNVNFVENTNIHGFVTVIKNEGRPDEQILCKNKKNLLTTIGRDKIHEALYKNPTATQPAFNFIALSVNTWTPVVGDTTLLGEITTGGLERIQASTRTHNVSSNTTTLSHQFTATAIHTAVQLSGLFDVIGPPPAGTLGHENTFTPATLQVSDTLTVTWTITAG